MREATASRAADLAVGVMGAQQRLPRSFLSPVPVLPTWANPNRRGSLCADHSPVVFLLCHNSSLILMNRALQQGHRGKPSQAQQLIVCAWLRWNLDCAARV